MSAPDAEPAALAARLSLLGCVAPGDEARLLLADRPSPAELEQRVARRAEGEPLAWITGSTVFAGVPLTVAPGTYVPRPQTELLLGRALARLPPGGRALDLCCGIGAIGAGLRAHDPAALVVGVDVDPVAAACAQRNGVRALAGDLDAPLRPRRPVDVVTAVPPYVPTGQLGLLPADVQRHEPRRALDGGADGLEVARGVVAAAARLLRAGGWLLLELGADQDGLLAPALAAAGFTAVEPWFDDDGDLRGLEAQRAQDLATESALRWERR